MLDNQSDINGEEPVSSRPTLYASHDNNRHNRLAAGLKLPGGSVITAPSSAQQGHVPDVRGLGIREAVVTLEKAGYNVEFSGIGYVASQQPSGGAPAPAGSKVTITLKQD